MTSTQIAWLVVAIVVVVLVLIAIVALSRRARGNAQRRRSEELRGKFGAEYDRVVDRTGDARRADEELAERQRRYRTYSLRDLTDAQRQAYAEDWQRLQTSFVDRPGLALGDADRLVADLMRTRGFPMTDAETAAADLSVEHADAVEAFRQGHAIAISGTTDAERMRIGMLMFRQVVEQLLSRDDHVVDLRGPSAAPSLAAPRESAPMADPEVGGYGNAGYESKAYPGGPVGPHPAGTEPRIAGTDPRYRDVADDGAIDWRQPPPPR